jgi:hypothetical protein
VTRTGFLKIDEKDIEDERFSASGRAKLPPASNSQ